MFTRLRYEKVALCCAIKDINLFLFFGEFTIIGRKYTFFYFASHHSPIVTLRFFYIFAIFVQILTPICVRYEVTVHKTLPKNNALIPTTN